MNDVEHVLAVKNELGEGPLWDPSEDLLYWVDIQGRAIFCYDPTAGKHEKFVVDLPVTALGLRSAGGFITATRDGFAFWDSGNTRLSFISGPEIDRSGTRFNDGAVDRQGRFWAGTMKKDEAIGNLYRLDPDNSIHTMETGITVSNGIGWGPDGKTMYFTDTLRHVIYMYEFDPLNGALANRRPFVRTPEGEGVPDGLTVDSEGFVWSVQCRGWKIVRYDPNGKIEREVHLPVECPTSCAFGGEGLDKLYITSSRSLVPKNRRSSQPLAGDLFCLETEVPGLEEPRFKG